MAQALVKNGATPLLPEWVESRIGSLKDSRTSAWQKTLPAAMVLSDAEKSAIEGHARNLQLVLGRTPQASAEAEAETLILITKLLKALPGQRLDELGAEATGEAYQQALDDVPPWAVEQAIRGWYRGESTALDRNPHDFRFRPAPGILARLARHATGVIRARILELAQLANAVPLIDYGEEHKRDMRAKLRELPVVGALILPELAEKSVDNAA